MSIRTMIIRAIVKLARVTTGAQTIQALDGRGLPTDDDVELYEQPGVSFRLADGDEVLLLELGSDPSNLTAIGTSGRGKRPTVAIEAGEGGLYYAGMFKVFLKNDGNVYLGSKDATDYVALASKVEAELAKIKNAISGAAVSGGDGGAAFKANIIAGLTSSGMGAAGSTAATKVLGE